MKNFIANFLIVVTLFTISVIFASAQKPTLAFSSTDAIGKAADMEANTSSVASLFSVAGFHSRVHTYRVSAGECAQIILDGDDDTDLDLFVYDASGRLIASGTSYSDYEVLYVNAHVNTTMTVKVVNRGSVLNAYDLTVWIR